MTDTYEFLKAQKDAIVAKLSINIPKSDAANWIPGRMVQFTIYTLPEPAKVTP
ncbi:MAG: hypothetical protein KAX57_11885 [Rhodoferax sp.]|nr:hypothetical protein [Rhodoferax sp.]